MFSRVRRLSIIMLSLCMFFISCFSNAYVNEEVHSLNREDMVINKLHQVVDRSLLEEFEDNGLASIAGGIVGSMIGISWDGLTTGNASPLFVDFTISALRTGAALGTLSIVSRTYLKTPFDYLSRPLSWGVYTYSQWHDWVLHEEPSSGLKQKYSEFLDPVSKRLKAIVEQVFDVPAHYWTITHMDMRAPNAFATSGYNIAVYHSFFPLAKNQAGMACILGHEMGHVLAKHVGQGLSDFIFLNLKALASIPFTNSIFQNREAQADEIGIYLTALAGYDPSECSRVWGRISAFSGNLREVVNIFLSTHPTNKTRMNALKQHENALQEYYSNKPQVLGLGLEYTL
ncbi:M48 family metalloprotease [Endozoicomonas sp. SCSIO W0465]|uniref:M48 family metalloprotease n=1 Tax=Endozoicomonas sp. SCSIO W0465 TaxID=2918516 RepID=UPI0020754028|nr:M48 family metalloprotease [Endozoicomonas sp. SCSIO W0465]USE37559.1 M48 family metalloprotease [Endozoicomonas sp. SCSIO W0465]